MRLPQLLGLAAVGVIALAACGGGAGSSGASSSYGAPVSSPPAAAQATTTAVHAAQTTLGQVLVDANGHTLYGRTADVNGMSSCVGACATAWPPLTVASATLPARYDAHVFSVLTRADGSHQLRAGRWPLYRYAGDAAAGDTNGQGVAGFFAVQPTGALHTA